MKTTTTYPSDVAAAASEAAAKIGMKFSVTFHFEDDSVARFCRVSRPTQLIAQCEERWKQDLGRSPLKWVSVIAEILD